METQRYDGATNRETIAARHGLAESGCGIPGEFWAHFETLRADKVVRTISDVPVLDPEAGFAGGLPLPSESFWNTPEGRAVAAAQDIDPLTHWATSSTSAAELNDPAYIAYMKQVASGLLDR